MCVYMYTTNQWRVTRGTGKRAALWPGGHPLGKQQSCEGGWAPSQHCLVGDLSGPFGDGELRGGVHCEWTPWEWCGGCDETRGRGAAGDEAGARRSREGSVRACLARWSEDLTLRLRSCLAPPQRAQRQPTIRRSLGVVIANAIIGDVVLKTVPSERYE